MAARMPQDRVSAQEVRHIAELSNLRLSVEEEGPMQRDLNAILNYVDELNELDTAEVVPMAQVSEILASQILGNQDTPGLAGDREDSRNVLRADLSGASLHRALVMDGAPETDGLFFKVPKVIER
jgi:aspartyl-tRNA(Asn)/glutamyl-tRNA(Gln) amidotransferase subunit C